MFNMELRDGAEAEEELTDEEFPEEEASHQVDRGSNPLTSPIICYHALNICHLLTYFHIEMNGSSVR